MAPPHGIRTRHGNVLMFLDMIGWLACVIYATIPWFWLSIHAHVEYWRSRPLSPYRLLIPLWIGMWVVLGVATAPWRNMLLYSTPWTWVPAAFLLAGGFRIYHRSRAGFSGSQLGGLPEVVAWHRDQRLVTSGIRAHVRHPVYLGHLCAMLAWSVGTGLAVCYGLTAFAVVSGVVMVRLEDKELEQRFGEQYRQYRQKVPAVLPRI
jgi:protein-S-isoprenylcysteine O-methyltransferase Ste14